MILKTTEQGNGEIIKNARRREDPQAGAPASVGDGRVALLFGLQRSHVNGYVQRLLRSASVQAKLSISEPGDQYEQEADRVADRVMRMPDDSTPAAVRSDGLPHISGLQRKCAQCEEEEIHRQPMNGTMGEEEEESPLQAKEVPGHSPQVTPSVQAQIDGLRGGGEPLPES